VTRRTLRLGILLLASALLVACERSAPSQAPPLAPQPSSDPSGGACDEPTTDASIVLFDLDGMCLSGDTMLLYRCSPAEVPVLRMASEDGAESFLGGPFAVPVSTVPANVRFIGRGDGTEVLVSDPLAGMPTPSSTESGSPPLPGPLEVEPLVYVRHDGVTERWLRLERGRSVADPPLAWLIGDSILDGGRDAVSESLDGEWSLTIDAEVGRPSSQGVPLAAEAADQGADAVLVELGTNDSEAGEFRGHLVETLELLRDVPLVLWQTARGPEELTTIAQVNEAIREVVPRYPNTAVADWEAFVPVEELMDDGIHPRDGSEGLEAELLTPILETWRGAVSGDGATSCGRQVVRASS
jgi:hypothetical protein